MFQRSVLAIALAVLFLSPSISAQVAATSPGMWLNVQYESPSDGESVKAEVPLAPLADVIKALPESVISDLEEESIPLGIIAFAATSLGNFEPMTLFNHEGTKISTKAREDKAGTGKTATLLCGVIHEDPKSSTPTTEFALPLDAVEPIIQQMKSMDLGDDFFSKPEEMKKAVGILAAALKASPPGELVRVKSDSLNVHIWAE